MSLSSCNLTGKILLRKLVCALKHTHTQNTYCSCKVNIFKRIQKPEIYKSNLATHAINTGNEFSPTPIPVSYTHLDVYKRQWLR